MKYIEMIGLSGVGKTTILSSPLSPLNKNCVICEPVRPSRLSHVFHFFYLFVGVVLSSPVSAVHVVKKREWIRLLLKLAYRVAGIKRRQISSKEVVFLRDSGVLMPIVSSILDDRLNISCYPIKKLLGLLPLPETVFFILDKSDDAVYERFIRRESIKGRDLSSYSPAIFSTASIFLFELADVLERLNINVEKIYINLQEEEIWN
ncbi:MAG: hypothetical protein VW437_00930 [Betaproteobacteria bacterium]